MTMILIWWHFPRQCDSSYRDGPAARWMKCSMLRCQQGGKVGLHKHHLVGLAGEFSHRQKGIQSQELWIQYVLFFFLLLCQKKMEEEEEETANVGNICLYEAAQWLARTSWLQPQVFARRALWPHFDTWRKIVVFLFGHGTSLFSLDHACSNGVSFLRAVQNTGLSNGES